MIYIGFALLGIAFIWKRAATRCEFLYLCKKLDQLIEATKERNKK